MARWKLPDTPWSRRLPAIIAVAAMIVLGFVQGLYSDRWTDADADAAERAKLLVNVPLVIGDWEGTDVAADEREVRVAGAVGHLNRNYRNRRTGDVVSLFLICGHSRNVSVHTPDRCYPAAGFTSAADPERFVLVDAGNAGHEFFTTVFRSKEEASGSHLVRVFWTWGNEEKWLAPSLPRFAYGGLRSLFKLYLIAPVSPTQTGPQQSPSVEFGKELMPRVTEALFPPAIPAGNAGDGTRSVPAT